MHNIYIRVVETRANRSIALDLKIDATRAHLHGIASFKRQHISVECAL